MATKPPAGFKLGAVRPQDAINAFTQRRLLRPSFRWQEVWQEEHARAFAVAGVMRLDILQLIRDQVDDAVTNGTDLRSFSDTLRQQLQAKGWWGDMEITDPETGEVRTTRFNDRRLKLIYDVNMRQSHAAGTWARGMRSKMPFIVYRTMDDEKVRKSHRAWNWIVLPRDHPWWDTHIPPNDWLCRCFFYFTDQAGIDALLAAGKPLQFEAPRTEWVAFENKVTGRVEQVPAGVGPGFAYNPGKVHVERAGDLLVDRIERLSTVPAAAPRQPTADARDPGAIGRAVVARMRTERAFKQFLAEPPPRDVGMPVATVPAQGREPTVISVSARTLRAQAATADQGFPMALPVTVAQWALAQAITDQGERIDLADGRKLWWWQRGTGGARRVLVLVLERSPLVWWTQQLATLTVEEAVAQFPPLAKVL